MSLTVQFAVLPSFSQLVLPDLLPVKDALGYVYAARNKDPNEENASSKANQILSAIHLSTGSQTVGELRRLSDHDWKALDVPAICRIYLKHIVRQSSRGSHDASTTLHNSTLPVAHHSTLLPHSNSTPFSTSSTPLYTSTSASITPLPLSPATTALMDPFLLQLQNDFNYGQPLSLMNYLSSLSNMGFKRDESLEALCMTDNKSVELALEILFITDLNLRKKKRAEAVEKLGRSLAQATAHSTTSSSAAAAVVGSTAQGPPPPDKLSLFTSYLRGLLIEEPLSIRRYEALKNESKKMGLSKSDQMKCLERAGVNEQKWQKMRKERGKHTDSNSHAGGERDEYDMDCVVCLDNRKDHVIMPCRHLALCVDCAPTFDPEQREVGSNAKIACPVCQGAIQDVIKIFLS